MLRKTLDHYQKSTLDPLEALLLFPGLMQRQTNDTTNEEILLNHTRFRIMTATSGMEPPLIRHESSIPSEAMDNLTVASYSTSTQKGEPTESTNHLTVRYYKTLPNAMLPLCLQLFTTNMKELYETSTWGFNIDDKQKELQHPNARFIIITPSFTDDYIVAFVHFRYCYDDDDNPTLLALYVYELQVKSQYQKQGVGKYCMQLMEFIATHGFTTPPPVSVPAKLSTSKAKDNIGIAAINKSGHNTNKNSSKKNSVASAPDSTTTGIKKIMLTVFRQNTAAMEFYRSKLQYTIDSTSPSQYNQVTDYEILSKDVVLV